MLQKTVDSKQLFFYKTNHKKALSMCAGTSIRQSRSITLVLVHSGPAAAETALYGYEVIHPPNSPASHVCQMYSDHPGGANVANGDGSVRFVSEFINQDVWQYVSSIADGEVISSGAW